MEAWMEAQKREMEAIEAEYRARRREIDANLRERLANIEATFKELNTMEQLMEFMKTQFGSLERKMDSNQERMDGKMDYNQEKTETAINSLRSCLEVTHACLVERKEPAPEETEVVAETEEVPEGATDEEAIGAAKDRSRNRRLAVRCRGRLKTRTKCDGRVRQDCAATVGRPTRRFVPALHKGGFRRGPGKKCRSGTGGQKCRRGGIKGLGKTSGSRMEGRSLRQRRPEYNVVRGTAEGRTDAKRRRTRPECNSIFLWFILRRRQYLNYTASKVRMISE
jgi:hypothetical protein